MASEIKTYPPVMGSSNLKFYARFENGALTTDSSGNSHTLTAISDPAEDTSGKFGSAVALDGNDAYSAVDHADFKPTGNFTAGFWIKTTSASVSYIFQSYSQNTDRAGWRFLMDTNGTMQFLSAKNTGTIIGTDAQVITGSSAINNNVWRFVVATWDGSYLRLYVDGVSDATAVAWANAPAYAATNYVRIGCYNPAGTNTSFFTGSLDDVFLINGTALSAQQVSDIYNENCNKFFQLF